MKYFRLTIRIKYLIVTMIFFSLFTLVSFRIWYNNFYKEASSASTDKIETIVKASNTNFERYLKDIHNIMTLISIDTGSDLNANILKILSEPDLAPADYVTFRRTAKNYLSGLCSFKSYLTGMAISDFNGNDITYGSTKTYEELSKEDWFEKIQTGDSKDLIFIPEKEDLVNPNNNYHNTFTMVKPVKSGTKTIGFVMANISYKIFDDYFDISPNENMNLLILDSSTNEKMLPLNYGASDVWKELSEEDIEALKKEAEQAGTEVITKEYHFTYDEIVAVAYISPVTGWITIGGISRREMMAGFYEANDKTILITVIMWAVSVIFIYIISSLLTRNILKLTAAVKSIDKDHLTFDAQVNSKDEVWDLQQQFQFMTRRIKGLIEDIRQTEQQKHHFEMQALQAQINPHFLHNTLNTIKFLASLQGADNIEETSDNLSAMLRINMDNRTMITIEEEIDYLNSYLEIQSYRYMNRFTTNIVCAEELKAYFIPKLLIQPILENALKHGIATKQDGIILVKIYQDEETLYVKVSDNGVGMPEDIQLYKVSNDHMGIYNINQRIRLYFGADYGLSIESQKELYTNIELTIPLISQKDVEQYV